MSPGGTSGRRFSAGMALAATTLLSGCTLDEATQDFYITCWSKKLGSAQKRAEAVAQGYRVNARFDCIDRISVEEVRKARAREAVLRSPEYQARRAAERAASIERGAAQRAAAEVAAKNNSRAGKSTVPLVDVNTATEAELAAVTPLDAPTAAKLISERQREPFVDWTDVIARVAPFNLAEVAAIASANGLTVNGESLPGVTPDAPLAQQIRARPARQP